MRDVVRAQVAAAVARARRYGWGLLAPASTLVAIFLTNVIASRRLGPAGFGEFAVASALVTILAVVAALGVPTTLVTLLGNQRDDAHVRDWRAAALATVWTSALVITLAVVAAELLLGARAARWLPPGTGLAIGLASTGTALLEVSLAEAQRLLEFRAYFARMVGAALVRLAGVAVALYAFDPTPRAAVWGYAIAALCCGVVLAAPSTRLAVRAARHARPQLLDHLVRLFGRSAPVMGSTIVVVAVGWLDTILLAGRMAAADVGVYAAAVRLTIAPSTLIGGISSLALPLAVTAWQGGRAAAFNATVLRVGTLLSIVVVGVMGAGAHLIVRIVYGEEFAAAGPVFMALAFGYLASFPGNPMSQVLFAAGRVRTMLVVQTAQLVATLVALGLMLGRVGPLEIAILRAVVNVAGTVVIMAVAWRLGQGQRALAPQA